MSDFGTMQAEIADDLARSDLTTQIKSAIKSAIRHYERKRYTFNETTNTFSTVASQNYYGAAALSDIPNMFAIDGMKCLSGGSKYTVHEKEFAYIDDIDTGDSTGDPTFFCLYNNQIRLYPTPDSVRTITVAYAYKLPTLSADADTNAWMVDGYDLIKACAKGDIYENVIRDFAESDRMKAKARDLNKALEAEYESRCGGGITPTSF